MDGCLVGSNDGAGVGPHVGASDRESVGACEGGDAGFIVMDTLFDRVGAEVGIFVGVGVAQS